MGTLEQLYLNVPSMFAYSLLKCVSIFLTSLIMLYSVTVIILLATGLAIDVRLLHILPVILLGMPALWAVSTAVGSLGLVLKQIGAVASVVGMIVVAWIPILAPKSQLACLLLPFGLSNKLSRDIFTGDTALGAIGLAEINRILPNDLAYVVLGGSRLQDIRNVRKRIRKAGTALTAKPGMIATGIVHK